MIGLTDLSQMQIGDDGQQRFLDETASLAREVLDLDQPRAGCTRRHTSGQAGAMSSTVGKYVR